jgi:hypothetical protein
METLQRTANRGSISTGYDIDNSCKFEDDNDERMSKTISSTNQKTHTISLWLKRTELGYRRTWGTGVSGNNEYFFYFDGNDKFDFYSYSSGYQLRFSSNRVFRDTSAWYHLVFAIDTTQSTEADRVFIYINGVQETSFSTATYPSQNADLQITSSFFVGTQRNESPDFSGYISEFVYLDGTQAVVTDFGEFDEDTGIWKPIDVSGLSFGTNGFYLDFKDASNLGNDASGGTDFTLNNITSADQATDTPTNNFCIANVIAIGTSNLFQFVEGGTVCKRITADEWDFFTTTMPVNKGKWYGEFQVDVGPVMVGIGSLSYFEGTAQSSHTGAGMATNSGVAYYGADGKRWVDNTEAAYGATFGTSDIISIAMDLDNDNVYFAKNGIWQNSGDPTSGATGTGALSTDPVGDYFVMTMNMLYNPNLYHKMNYGGYTTITISSAASDENGYGTFEYAPPSGYYALCTKNLAEFG